MRIGIFGGSFDPIHNEHVSLAKQAVADLSLDRLFVMPAANPPHKPWRALTSNEVREKLCALAFDGEERITVSDYELRSGGTSYTYLTIRHFKEEYPEAELYFLMGTDMLRDFPSWRNPDEIVKNCTLAICARAEDENWAQTEQEKFRQRFGASFTVLSYAGKDISSTKIRVLAGAGMDLTDFLPKPVARYVEENGVYAIKGVKESLSLQKPTRRAHSIRVAIMAAKRAARLKLNEKQVIQAALLHDCAKNLTLNDPLLDGFVPPQGCPPSVLHQYAGAYVARNRFKIEDEEVLSAIACHTSGKENMTELDKLIFLSDLVEEDRAYAGVERLRELFWEDLDECLLRSLEETVEYLMKSGQPIYEKTLQARDYYRRKQSELWKRKENEEKEKKDGND
ncbi:MAG: nicotinate (nicotinamide) nucleotide adenylyltransferase [Clostridia bacterium]|nr:nicotinate (nicotinamide) nucleotide adenylyltransferase [Clostridia bacterium]